MHLLISTTSTITSISINPLLTIIVITITITIINIIIVIIVIICHHHHSEAPSYERPSNCDSLFLTTGDLVAPLANSDFATISFFVGLVYYTVCMI